jgi:diacylglycerol O-acyltransferase / wax synthase
VPGPQVPLYLAGAKMVGNYPLSIVVHGVALNITVQSYMGQLCFGLIACRRAVPDVKELAAHLQQALVALRSMPMSVPVPVLVTTAAAQKPKQVPKPKPTAAVAPSIATAVKRPARQPRLKVVTASTPSPRSRRAAA